MRGRIINKDKDWIVSCLRKADANRVTETYEVFVLPLHPKDIPYVKDGDWINFEIVTIAEGTSEFDVQDVDVAKITYA